MEPRRSSRTKKTKTALELLGKTAAKRVNAPRRQSFQDGFVKFTEEEVTVGSPREIDEGADKRDVNRDSNEGEQSLTTTPKGDSLKDDDDTESSADIHDKTDTRQKLDNKINQNKQEEMPAVKKSKLEPGEITDFRSTVEPGEINYRLEPGEITGFSEDSPPVAAAGSDIDNSEAETHVVILPKTDSGKILEIESDSHGHEAFNALVQLASEAVEYDTPEAIDVPGNKSQSLLKDIKLKKEILVHAEETVIEVKNVPEKVLEEGEINMECGSETGEIHYANVSTEDNSNEPQGTEENFEEEEDDDEEEDDTLHRVAMKLINQNQGATTRELIEELDEMGEMDPITDLEINAQERSRRSGRYRPVKQIVMSKELQEMMDQISAKDNFEEHVEIEWGDAYPGGRRKIMKCRYCDKIILHKHDFRKHIKTHPNVDYKPFICPICGYKAQIKAQIVRHVNIHSDIKPYMCTECGKRFNFKQKLQLHMKYHMDIRDQLCPLCPLSFHEQKTLKNHLIKIHNIWSIKSFMREYSERKAQSRSARVDMSDYKSLIPNESGVVQILDYSDGKEKIQVLSAPENADNAFADFSNEANTAVPAEGANVLTEVIFEAHELSAEDAQHLVVVASGGTEAMDADNEPSQELATNSPMTVDENPAEKPSTLLYQKEQISHKVSNKNNDIEEILVSQDGSVSIAIPAKSFISQMGMEADDDVLNSYEDNQTKKRSMVYGCRKTKLQTHRFKLGLLPPEYAKKPKLESKDKDATSTTSKSVRRRSPKPTLGAKGKRFVNNQRCIREEQVEKNLLEFCTVENPPMSSTKDSENLKVKFSCKLCEEYGVSFPSKSQFVEHLEETHREIKAWKCHLCSYTCRLRTTLAVHLKVHTGIKEHHCHVCGRDFYFKQKLNAHLRHHANIRPHRCPECNKAFTEKNDLTKHIRRVHEENKPSTCEICKKDFKDRAQLKRHLNMHAGDKAFLCTYCQKYYRSKMSLNQHMKSHTCMFHCEICDRNFGSYSGFMAHKVMHDESYEGYVCELCNAVLHTKGSLNRHKKVAHSEVRPFVCSVCNKGFKAKKDLKNHEIVHLSTKQYVCSVCSFSCKRMESLRVHMRRHSEVKPYQCGVCGKEYTQKFSLETHLKRHTGQVDEVCSLCKKSFLTKYQLEQHMKRKHGMDNKAAAEAAEGEGEAEDAMTVFMCEECNAVFLTQDTLAVHILAEHMKQGFVGGPPLGVVSNDIKTEYPQSAEAPEAENVVEVVADGSQIQTNDEGDNSGDYEMETVERLVSISDPNSADGERYVTLVEPIQQQNSLIEDMPSDIVASTAEILSAKNFETIQQDSFEEKSGYGENTFTTFQQNPEDTFVTIKDPNTNEEYTVAVTANALGNLLEAHTESIETITTEEEGNQECVVVGETVEIPVQDNTYEIATEQVENE